MQPELTLLYVHGEDIGYARAGSYLANGLMERGVNVYDDHGYYWDKNKWSQQAFRHGHRNLPDSPTNLYCLISVPTHLEGWWEGQYRTILTMWEAMNLPESFREVFHEFEMILVPSEHNVELFSKFHDNVQLILLGVDPTMWHYKEPPPVTNEFRFLISGRGDRKGVDVAYKAFRKVFPFAKPTKRGMPVPKLIIKSARGIGDYWAPGIDQVVGKLPADEELSLYESCHCYVQPSRGEGFGLQPLQAMALGRPTILTDAHGHASYAKLGIPISATTSKAAYFIYGDAGLWWEPSEEEVCEAMWDVYHNYGDACAHASKAALNDIPKRFTWKNTVDRYIDLLGGEMAKPFNGRKMWHTPEPRLFRIITNRDWYGEIGGRSVYFQKGVEYYDVADVKRIFFDAGVLANECLEGPEDLGLAPIQVEQLQMYRAHEEACPTCGQILNSGIQKSDVILKELDDAASNGQH